MVGPALPCGQPSRAAVTRPRSAHGTELDGLRSLHAPLASVDGAAMPATLPRSGRILAKHHGGGEGIGEDEDEDEEDEGRPYPDPPVLHFPLVRPFCLPLAPLDW